MKKIVRNSLCAKATIVRQPICESNIHVGVNEILDVLSKLVIKTVASVAFSAKTMSSAWLVVKACALPCHRALTN